MARRRRLLDGVFEGAELPLLDGAEQRLRRRLLLLQPFLLRLARRPLRVVESRLPLPAAAAASLVARVIELGFGGRVRLLLLRFLRRRRRRAVGAFARLHLALALAPLVEDLLVLQLFLGVELLLLVDVVAQRLLHRFGRAVRVAEQPQQRELVGGAHVLDARAVQRVERRTHRLCGVQLGNEPARAAEHLRPVRRRHAQPVGHLLDQEVGARRELPLAQRLDVIQDTLQQADTRLGKEGRLARPLQRRRQVISVVGTQVEQRLEGGGVRPRADHVLRVRRVGEAEAAGRLGALAARRVRERLLDAAPPLLLLLRALERLLQPLLRLRLRVLLALLRRHLPLLFAVALLLPCELRRRERACVEAERLARLLQGVVDRLAVG